MTPSDHDFQVGNLANLETITDYLRFTLSTFNSADLFYGHGADNAWDEAAHLILGVLNLPWETDKSLLQSRLTSSEKQVLGRALHARVIDRLPVPYILGEAWFMGMPFEVTPEVLIPRSPIAELLENRLEPWCADEPTRILDLCCGSGCIGIGAAHVFEQAEVVISDISQSVLAIAARNIARYQLDDRIRAVKSDLFQAIDGKFDVILSNPPYVDAHDMCELPTEYRHEPKLALASGEDGLEATREIIADALNYLNPGGLLICEVGNSLEALLQQYPDLLFLCPEFERGGDGVFVLTREQLAEYKDHFTNKLP